MKMCRRRISRAHFQATLPVSIPVRLLPSMVGGRGGTEDRITAHAQASITPKKKKALCKGSM